MIYLHRGVFGFVVDLSVDATETCDFTFPEIRETPWLRRGGQFHFYSLTLRHLRDRRGYHHFKDVVALVRYHH